MSSYQIRTLHPTDPVPPALVELVQQASTGPPYCYADGEIDPAIEWFPPLVRRNALTLVAVNPSGEPIGYCVATPLADSHSMGEVENSLGVDPTSTYYVAELGVAEPARRCGLGAALVGAMVEATPSDIDGLAVRTLVDHHAAIGLYQGIGFSIVPGLVQIYHDRPRLFLTRPLDRGISGEWPGRGRQ